MMNFTLNESGLDLHKIYSSTQLQGFLCQIFLHLPVIDLSDTPSSLERVNIDFSHTNFLTQYLSAI